MNPKDAAAVAEERLCYHHASPIATALYVEVMTIGAIQYGWFNWREKPILEENYTSAIERHLNAIKMGEWFDHKSGKPHAAHIMAGASILLDANHYGTLVRSPIKRNGEDAKIFHRTGQGGSGVGSGSVPDGGRQHDLGSGERQVEPSHNHRIVHDRAKSGDRGT